MPSASRMTTPVAVDEHQIEAPGAGFRIHERQGRGRRPVVCRQHRGCTPRLHRAGRWSAPQWFPSFGPMQFAAGGAFGHTAVCGHLAPGLAWTVAFTVAGLVIFQVKSRNRTYRVQRSA